MEKEERLDVTEELVALKVVRMKRKLLALIISRNLGVVKGSRRIRN